MAGSLLARFALDSREKRAWAMYDWANSAFWTVIITAVFPVYYKKVASELPVDKQDLYFSLASGLALAVIALGAPILGAFADYRPCKKRFLAIFAFLGAASSALMFFVFPGDWLLALLLFAVANIGASGSVIFYDSLLPHVAGRNEGDRLSTGGFALGYLGGGLALALSLACIQKPAWFALPHGEGLSEAAATLPVRISLLAVGIWWAVFTLPLLFRVREPLCRIEDDETKADELGFGVIVMQLVRTFQELRRSYPQAFLFLLAFLIYNDGILTIIRMAGIIATNRGFSEGVIIGTILGIQFIAIPFAILFGQLATRFGAKPVILTGLAIYGGITLLACFMTEPMHFVALGVMVGMVQGGTQALSRSLFASMIPAFKSSEFFAFFSVGEKFAGIIGPATFAWVIVTTGSDQGAILALAAFFVVGGWLLGRVDISEGKRAARLAEETQT